MLYTQLKQYPGGGGIVWGNAIPVLGMELYNGGRVERIVVNFQHRPMFRHINGKPSPKSVE